jgi:hypothetical protein
MGDSHLLLCDSCGQPATPQHITGRLLRLEQATRYRPVHIGTLFLGAVAPAGQAECLYACSDGFAGEGKHVLAAAGISPEGKSAEGTLAEFQRAGCLLTHVLECPLDADMRHPAATRALLSGRLPALVARIRRSLRPKRLVPISAALAPLIPSLQTTDLGCPILLDNGKAFALDDDEVPDQVIERLRGALATLAVPARGMSSGA